MICYRIRVHTGAIDADRTQSEFAKWELEFSHKYSNRFFQWFLMDIDALLNEYERALRRRVVTEDTHGAIVLFSQPHVDHGWPPELEQLLDGVSLHWPFDFRAYATSDRATKKRMVVDEMHAGLCCLAERKGWAPGPFVEAHRHLHDQRLIVSTWHGKPVVSRDGRFMARVLRQYDLDIHRLVAVLFKNRGRKEVARRQLAELPRHAVGDLSKGYWSGKTRFAIRSKDEDEIMTFSADFNEAMLV